MSICVVDTNRRRSRSWAPSTPLRTCCPTWLAVKDFLRRWGKRWCSWRTCWMGLSCWTQLSASASTRPSSILSSRRRSRLLARPDQTRLCIQRRPYSSVSLPLQAASEHIPAESEQTWSITNLIVRPNGDLLELMPPKPTVEPIQMVEWLNGMKLSIWMLCW